MSRSAKVALGLVGLTVGTLAIWFLPSLTREGQVEGRGLAAIRREMIDPNSAQFDNVKVIENELGRMVCGRVNARNRMGGYAGAVPFAYIDTNQSTCIAKDYRAAFVCGGYLRRCFPAMRIPANGNEAHNWDQFGPPE